MLHEIFLIHYPWKEVIHISWLNTACPALSLDTGRAGDMWRQGARTDCVTRCNDPCVAVGCVAKKMTAEVFLHCSEQGSKKSSDLSIICPRGEKVF